MFSTIIAPLSLLLLFDCDGGGVIVVILLILFTLRGSL